MRLIWLICLKDIVLAAFTESKSGKVTWFHNVLEAKLVTPEGFCISLSTEWIKNPQVEFNKQDCQLKAFGRLAEKIKKIHPRMKICTVADGLYPQQIFFEIYEQKNWKWILTFQNGNLPSIWSQVIKNQDLGFRHFKGENFHYYWHKNLKYKGFTLHWIKALPVNGKSQFVFLSNFEVSRKSVEEIKLPPAEPGGYLC
jgi:hypothetical protein